MLLYRVRMFGQPKAPWRRVKRLAEQDALDLGLGSFDEWGKFFVSAPAEIEEVHERFVNEGVGAGQHRASCMSTPARQW